MIVVLILFLFDLRAAAICCTAIPISLLAAIIVLQQSGVTLNTMTLGGLADRAWRGGRRCGDWHREHHPKAAREPASAAAAAARARRARSDLRGAQRRRLCDLRRAAGLSTRRHARRSGRASLRRSASPIFTRSSPLWSSRSPSHQRSRCCSCRNTRERMCRRSSNGRGGARKLSCASSSARHASQSSLRAC